MVHMQCSSECATAQQDLQPAAQALFSVEDATGERREGWKGEGNRRRHYISVER